MNIKDISLAQLETMLNQFKQQREQIQQTEHESGTNLSQFMNNNAKKFDEINTQESKLLQEWFTELLNTFDRISGNDDNSFNDESTKEIIKTWTNANWTVSIADGRYALQCSATDTLKQFATNRHNIDSITRIRLQK